MMKKYYLWALLLIALTACSKDKKDKVIKLDKNYNYTFTVEIKSYWTAESHPNFFPSNAGFGKIVGFSHKKDNLLFKENSTSPKWLNSYLTSENTANFEGYYKDFQEVNKVTDIINIEGMTATEKKVFELKTIGQNNKFSFLTKIRPSDKWFIAGNNLELDRIANGGSLTYILSVFEANNKVRQMNEPPLSIKNGGVNTFATVTISYKNSEKIIKN